MVTEASPAQKEAGMSLPASGTWKIDPVHSAVTFVARHMVVAKIRGRFNEFSGTFTVSDVPENSSLEVSIAAASIDTADATRDGHVRSPDFLNTEQFPTITYRSTKVERTGERTLRVTGDLTIRDVTRPMTLDVAYEGLYPYPGGGTRAGFSAVGEIDRDAFGVTWNMALEAGGWMVGKKVRIEIEVEAAPAEA